VANGIGEHSRNSSREETMQILSKRSVVLLSMIFACLSRYGRPASVIPAKASLTIRLRSYDYAHLGSRRLEQTQGQVSAIFKRIGVTTEWVTDDAPQLRIFIVAETADTAASGADVFGYTPREPDGTHSSRAYVLYGRVQDFVRNSEPWRYPPLAPTRVLAYFVAHEIGHLLLPANSHSPVGIMRERWRDTDFKLMATANPSFTSEQANLIRKEVLRFTAASNLRIKLLLI
jgi:hypothetical protein